MKVLVVSNTPWRNDNSFGNSYSNIFEGIPNMEFANIYCRYGNPDNNVAKDYFQITEKSLISNLKNKNKASGKRINVLATDAIELNQSEGNNVDFIRKKRFVVFYWFRDLIWKIGRWKSKELNDFIDEVNPDIIFQPIYYSNYINKIALYAKKRRNVKMIGYISDDNYTLRQFSLSPFYWIDRFIKRPKVKKAIKNCEVLYVISEIQKKEYEKIFKVPCKVLTKIADFDSKPETCKEVSSPLNIAFTGNIGMGRWKSLGIIAKALGEINKNGCKAKLQIFTATPLTEQMKRELNIEGSSEIVGQVPASEVIGIQKNADILVHAEGLDLKSRLYVHQSFSTKIVDYLNIPKCILAIGTPDVASIDFFIKNDCGIVASTKEEVKQKLLLILDNPDEINQYAEKAYETGRKYCQKNVVQADLYKTIKKYSK